MTRRRLREARPEGEAVFYANRYPAGYRHDVWPDHVERVAASVELIRRYRSLIRTVADLSCGDAEIVKGIAPDLARVYLGDVNGVPIQAQEAVGRAGAGHIRAFSSGILPDSLSKLPEPVDLFVLSETLEHVDDPDGLLRGIGEVSRYLFLSTPLDEAADSGNLEHYWSWDQSDVHAMLLEAGWSPLELQRLRPESTRHLPTAYTYQLWMAVRAA